MSNRKENLKKSLGITEYPWSSDDEDNPQNNQDTVPASRRYLDSDGPHGSGPSGADASTSAVSPTRRNPTRLERDLYWSLQHNPNIINIPIPPSRNQKILTFTRRAPHLEDVFWSAAGEENSQNNQEVIPGGRRRYLGTDTPQPPVADTSTSALSPTRRNPSQTERIYWSENNLNNGSGPSRSRDPPEAHDLRLMQAINRLTRNFCRHPHFMSSQRGAASRNIIFNPSMQTNVAAALGTSRFRRRPSYRAPLPTVRTSIIPPVMDEERASSPARTAHSRPQSTEQEQNSDDDSDPPERSTFIVGENERNNDGNNEETNDENNAQQQENMDVDISDGGGQLEEEGGEENREPDDNDNDNDIDVEVLNETEQATVASPAQNSTPPVEQTSQSAKRRRETRENMEPETVKDFNQCLLGLLECPVCLEWMEPPMSQCRRGHLVCGRCRARLSACPVCRTAFSSVRNRAMEAVAELVRYPCRHECGRDAPLPLPRAALRRARPAAAGRARGAFSD